MPLRGVSAGAHRAVVEVVIIEAHHGGLGGHEGVGLPARQSPSDGRTGSLFWGGIPLSLLGTQPTQSTVYPPPCWWGGRIYFGVGPLSHCLPPARRGAEAAAERGRLAVPEDPRQPPHERRLPAPCNGPNGR